MKEKVYEETNKRTIQMLRYASVLLVKIHFFGVRQKC